MTEKITKGLSGVAGEYFVAAELSRRGYLASITLRNTRGIDILATNHDASRSVGIQVKTNQGSGRDWVLREKAESLFSDNLYYVFVNLNGQGLPTYHIVPSNIVAEHCRTIHQTWLETPGRSGQKHNENTMRKFSDKDGLYLNKWQLLNL